MAAFEGHQCHILAPKLCYFEVTGACFTLSKVEQSFWSGHGCQLHFLVKRFLFPSRTFPVYTKDHLKSKFVDTLNGKFGINHNIWLLLGYF